MTCGKLIKNKLELWIDNLVEIEHLKELISSISCFQDLSRKFWVEWMFLIVNTLVYVKSISPTTADKSSFHKSPQRTFCFPSFSAAVSSAQLDLIWNSLSALNTPKPPSGTTTRKHKVQVVTWDTWKKVKKCLNTKNINGWSYHVTRAHQNAISRRDFRIFFLYFSAWKCV